MWYDTERVYYKNEVRMEQFFRVGVITSTHGVRGEVKVYPTTDDPQRFKKLKKVILDTGKQKLDMEVASVKFFKNMVILKFKGIDNINDVEKYRQADILVTRENAVKLEEGEYFIADLIGLQGISDEGEDLGELTDVLQTGANDVYEIKSSDNKEIYIPAIKDVVKKVDVKNKKMYIEMMEGLQ
jgi:16S rRNA processing protein RimM